MSRLLCLLSIIVCVFGEPDDDARFVTIEGQGRTMGVKYWDGDYHEFYAIPYASAPTGRDRFKDPLPPKPWTTTFEANKALHLCQQVYWDDKEKEDYVTGLEDCLALNIMTPKIATPTNMVPVVVYIHNGAYASGSGITAKVEKLGQEDIVVVTLNYRLGAIGFACLGTETIPGNAALKDIIAALKWINKNINAFGGDPNQVTLAGYSIGAALAELIALNKEADGLFHRLILDSGSALSPYAVDRDPLNTARNIAKASGFEDSGTIKDLEEFLLEADILPLQKNSQNYFLKNSTFGFVPCIQDPKLQGAILTESPYETLKRGDYPKFDVLTGFADMEGISRISQIDNWSEEMVENFSDFLPVDLAFAKAKNKREFIKEIFRKYFKDDEITLRGFIDYSSDSMFKYGQMRSAKLHAARQPIYLYEFTYVGKLNTQHSFKDILHGASHRDATAYVLDFYDWSFNFTDMDHRDRMCDMWADFIKFGDPTAYESDLVKVKWEKYTAKQPNYLDIGYELVNKKGLFEESYQFWDKAYQSNYWNPTAPDPNSYKPTVAKGSVKKPDPPTNEITDKEKDSKTTATSNETIQSKENDSKPTATKSEQTAAKEEQLTKVTDNKNDKKTDESPKEKEQQAATSSAEAETVSVDGKEAAKASNKKTPSKENKSKPTATKTEQTATKEEQFTKVTNNKKATPEEKEKQSASSSTKAGTVTVDGKKASKEASPDKN